MIEFVSNPEAIPVKLIAPTAPDAPSDDVEPVVELVPERLLLKLMVEYLVLIFGIRTPNAQENERVSGPFQDV
jgi:hypothetical protein